MTAPLANITITVGAWVWIGAGVTVTALCLLVWAYRRASLAGRLLHIAFILKMLALLLLVICLTEPLWHGQRAKPGANWLVVMADNSMGMNVRESGSSRTRGDQLKSVFEVENTAWLGKLEEQFQVRKYLFDSRLHRTSDFSELKFDGRASAMYSALETVTRRYQGRPVAGVLLLTDGNPTDLPSAEKPDLPPLYPVVVGHEIRPKDLAVSNVSVTQTAFEDAPVTIQAEVEAAGFSGTTVNVDLRNESDELVERQPWDVQDATAKNVVRFRLRPDQSGVVFYKVQVNEQIRHESDSQLSLDQADDTDEASLANNQRTVMVDRGTGPYRILYVSGRPNWEYKFLRRALSEDEQVQLVGLIRVAKREPKYDWRGHAGEQTNPLYRGYEKQDDSLAEQYDQPVLIRLNTRDEKELSDGFPKTEADMFAYHALILDDVDAEFFTRDQMELIRRFVSERGGGFLMLGGAESFEQGQFDRTPISTLLPIHLDRLSSYARDENAAPAAHTYRLSLTREGWLEPWVRLRDKESAERNRLSDMPDFSVLNRVESIKPGARVVAAVSDDAEDDPIPALVVQSYGRGRSAALMIGDIWQWGLGQPNLSEDRGKFWRQTLRWLVADVPDRIALQAAYHSDQAVQVVHLRTRVRDKTFTPMDDVAVTLTVSDTEGKIVTLTAEPDLSERGLYQATYVPRTSGAYRAEAVITNSDGLQLGQVQTGWAVDLEAREFRSLEVNRPLLERLAAQTGGRVLTLDDLNQFARELPTRNVPVTETWIRPLWDLPGILPLLFLVILLCLGLEWTLRRWKGVP